MRALFDLLCYNVHDFNEYQSRRNVDIRFLILIHLCMQASVQCIVQAASNTIMSTPTFVQTFNTAYDLQQVHMPAPYIPVVNDICHHQRPPDSERDEFLRRNDFSADEQAYLAFLITGDASQLCRHVCNDSGKKEFMREAFMVAAANGLPGCIDALQRGSVVQNNDDDEIELCDSALDKVFNKYSACRNCYENSALHIIRGSRGNSAMLPWSKCKGYLTHAINRRSLPILEALLATIRGKYRSELKEALHYLVDEGEQIEEPLGANFLRELLPLADEVIVNSPDDSGDTLLNKAVLLGKQQWVSLLLQHQADPAKYKINKHESCNARYSSPIIEAARSGSLTILTSLLEAESSDFEQDVLDVALDEATKGNHTRCAALLRTQLAQ